MSTTLSCTFQPQPPPHPKTTGGKRGPSGPISIASSSSEDEDSDHSITDFSPPVPSRLTGADFGWSPGTKYSGALSVTSLSSPRGQNPGKKVTGLLPSPRSLNNNNASTVNLNHSNLSHSSTVATTPPINGSSHSSPGLLSTGTVGNSFLVSQNVNTKVILANSSASCSGPPPVPSAASSSSSSQSSFLTQLNNVSVSNNNSASNTYSTHTSNSSRSTNTSAVPCTSICTTNNSIVNANIPSTANNCGNNTTTTAVSSGHSNSNSNSSASSTISSITSKDAVKEEIPPTSPRNRSCSPLSSSFAYEHDHDYENVASPCSSTASGPIYVRPPGFEHHAHEITLPSTVKNKLKKKKSMMTVITLKDGFKKRESTPPRLKPKREPLPMKLRALPQSFWQQPNVAHQVSPATLFPILPPLSTKDTEEVMEVRPTTPPTPPEECESVRKTQGPDRKLTVANTDLLFKLFEGIDDEKKSGHVGSKSRNQPRQRKLAQKGYTKGPLLGNDPYMMEGMSEKIFPQLTLEASRHTSGGGNTMLQLITLKEGDKTVTLPSLSMEQNYPQMLSELVMHI